MMSTVMILIGMTLVVLPVCCCMVTSTAEERAVDDEEFLKWAREQLERKNS